MFRIFPTFAQVFPYFFSYIFNHLFLGSDRIFPAQNPLETRRFFWPWTIRMWPPWRMSMSRKNSSIWWWWPGGCKVVVPCPPIKCERWLIRFDKPWKKSWVSIDISGYIWYICHRPGDFPSFSVCLPEGMLLWNCWPRESQCYKDL